tara:strand:+ start:4032 stop:4703 length:672 start_codon:yes stop_codon:yes gene_type:complete
MIKLLNENDVSSLIQRAPSGENTKFLKNAHNLWFRFKNYQRYPCIALYKDSLCVAVIYATFSDKTGYTNLYEICTMQNMERKGYATEIWSEYLKIAYERKMKRLKISCTPESIGWHKKNGLVFWGVDKQGSLKSDQPLKRTREEQIRFRDKAVIDPGIAKPDEKVCEKLKNEQIENVKLNPKQGVRTWNAIKNVGDYYLGRYLWTTENYKIEKEGSSNGIIGL